MILNIIINIRTLINLETLSGKPLAFFELINYNFETSLWKLFFEIFGYQLIKIQD